MSDLPAESTESTEKTEPTSSEPAGSEPVSDAAPSPASDLVAASFAKARSLSPKAPRLDRRPPQVRRTFVRSLDERAEMRKFRLLGRESGPDGRAPRKKLAVPSTGAQLSKLIREMGWEQELMDAWVFSNWADIVGERNAEHTEPQKIENQTLFVSCDSSAYASQMRYMQRQIIKKIAERMGDDLVRELRFLGPAQHKNYQGPLWVKPQGSTDTYG